MYIDEYTPALNVPSAPAEQLIPIEVRFKSIGTVNGQVYCLLPDIALGVATSTALRTPGKKYFALKKRADANDVNAVCTSSTFDGKLLDGKKLTPTAGIRGVCPPAIALDDL
jgi:hypothetical protein